MMEDQYNCLTIIYSIVKIITENPPEPPLNKGGRERRRISRSKR
jgi:hypothetical protein